MKRIHTKVQHSQSKPAWNIIGTIPGGKYKIARVPYTVIEGDEILTTMNKAEALDHAQFISQCFNHHHEDNDCKTCNNCVRLEQYVGDLRGRLASKAERIRELEDIITGCQIRMQDE